jgi:hypothetical protein
LNEFSGEIRKYFDLHLCGHMHAPDEELRRPAGAESNITRLGASLFGVEKTAEGLDRRHGYSAGRIEFTKNGLTITCWPRKAHRPGTAGWRFSPDEYFALEKGKFEYKVDATHHPRPTSKLALPVTGVRVSDGPQLLTVEVEQRTVTVRGLAPAPVMLDKLGVEVVKLFQRWLLDRDRIRSIKEPILLGRILFRALFSTNNLRSEFVRRCNAAKAAKQPLRVRLLLEKADPELKDLPWEYMYYMADAQSEQSFFLSTQTDLNLLRGFEPVNNAALRPKSKGALTIKIISAEPPEAVKDLDGPATPDVTKVLQDAKLTANWFPGTDVGTHDACIKFLKGPVDIVHFIGCRRGEQLVWFRNNTNPVRVGEIPSIEHPSFADCFKENPPRVVLLQIRGAPSSEFQSGFADLGPALMSAGVSMVVALQQGLSLDAARAFVTQFYNALGEKKTVDEAVQIGRSALSAQNVFGFGLPVMYLCGQDAGLFERAGQSRTTTDDTRPSAADRADSIRTQGEPSSVPVSVEPFISDALPLSPVPRRDVPKLETLTMKATLHATRDVVEGAVPFTLEDETKSAGLARAKELGVKRSVFIDATRSVRYHSIEGALDALTVLFNKTQSSELQEIYRARIGVLECPGENGGFE